MTERAVRSRRLARSDADAWSRPVRDGPGTAALSIAAGWDVTETTRVRAAIARTSESPRPAPTGLPVPGVPAVNRAQAVGRLGLIPVRRPHRQDTAPA